MAKYDSYELVINVVKQSNQYTAKITVLFEDGDNVPDVLSQAAQQLRTEAIRLKTTNFLNDIA